jgi:hypothetical protein
MPSIKEELRSRLLKCGMSEDQAYAVINKAERDLLMSDIVSRWHSCIDEYPQPITELAWHNLKSVALEWIEENKPLAWFKPVFMHP